jgi:hypothetical protein
MAKDGGDGGAQRRLCRSKRERESGGEMKWTVAAATPPSSLHFGLLSRADASVRPTRGTRGLTRSATTSSFEVSSKPIQCGDGRLKSTTAPTSTSQSSVNQ